MRIRALLTVGLCCQIAACASGTNNVSTINSRAAMSVAAKPRRMIIFLNSESAYFSGVTQATFRDAIRTRLESCGVTVTLIDQDPLELDPKQKIATAVARSRPEASLTVTRDGGNVTRGSATVWGSLDFNSENHGHGHSEAHLESSHQLQDHALEPEFQGQPIRRTIRSGIVSRLATDKVIDGCPPELLPYIWKPPAKPAGSYP